MSEQMVMVGLLAEIGYRPDPMSKDGHGNAVADRYRSATARLDRPAGWEVLTWPVEVMTFGRDPLSSGSADNPACSARTP